MDHIHPPTPPYAEVPELGHYFFMIFYVISESHEWLKSDVGRFSGEKWSKNVNFHTLKKIGQAFYV